MFFNFSSYNSMKDLCDSLKKKGYIRDSDTYCNVGWQTLAKYISSQYGTTFHSNWSLKQGCGHYWVVNQNGKEVFNAAGLGYTGCK